MDDLIEKLEKYIKESFNFEISLHLWKDQKKIPFFLLDIYTFFETSFLNNACLLMISKDVTELTPNVIQKHREQIAKKWNGPCIYISSSISSYNRKRLIQHHIPFIIPNNQIYVPDLGLDLLEYFKKQRIPKKKFTSSAQAAIILLLIKEKIERVTPSELSPRLGYSAMTMTRVFDELEAAGIGKLIKKGKERWWIFEETKRDLWEQTKDMMRSPIRRREWMKLYPKGNMPETLSGISALSETTMIYPPEIPIYAMYVEEFLHNKSGGLQYSSRDEADIELEIWNYDPKRLSEHGKVDPFSLYLCLRETKEERIEAALEELMEKIEW